MRRSLVVVLLLLVLLLAGAAAFLSSAGGFSARTEATAAEKRIARLMRRLATPRDARNAPNPVTFTPDVWADSRAHFADHCATCHGNDGSGQTDIGRNLYPKAPDMREADTQNLSDGELYWIITNGVRLTGMPAWGSGGANDTDSWKLVHFVRHLTELTPEHLKEMEALNPKSPEELEEERQDRDFLEGKPATPAASEKNPHVHKE